MELKLFVSETLKQLFDGVKDAQPYVKELGGALNPMGLNYPNARLQHRETSRMAEEIEFDLELTVTDSKEETKSGGLGAVISVLTANVGKGSKTAGENRSVTRIKFKIPVLFPRMKYEEKETQKNQ
jgi:hypothetical protein